MTINMIRNMYGMKDMKVSGFSDSQIEFLRSLGFEKRRDEIVRILDEENGNLGTCWACGYGIYGIQIEQDGAGTVTVSIGESAD